MSAVKDQGIASAPIWIWGGSGLLAGELARLIAGHPGLHLQQVVSRQGDKLLREQHPHLTGELRTVEWEAGLASLKKALTSCAESNRPGLFLALPHGQSAAMWQRISAALGEHAKQLAVVDLSADYRLHDPALHEANYGSPPPDPEAREAFVFGLPEYWRSQIFEGRRVAAPGCFATAMLLAVLPAAIAGQLDTTSPWILNGVTGSSGSGITPGATTHHPFRHGSYRAYSPGGHRHTAELSQALGLWSVEAPLHFLPHSGPWSRGIYLSCSLPLCEALSDVQARAIFAARYAGEPFVEVLPVGGIPELRAVVGSNRASIGVHVNGQVLTVLLALDNTLKGGAGQALQSMNILLGRPETAGLPTVGLGY